MGRKGKKSSEKVISAENDAQDISALPVPIPAMEAQVSETTLHEKISIGEFVNAGSPIVTSEVIDLSNSETVVSPMPVSALFIDVPQPQPQSAAVLDASHLPPPPPRRQPVSTHSRHDSTDTNSSNLFTPSASAHSRHQSTDTNSSQFSPAALPSVQSSPIQPWTAVPVLAVGSRTPTASVAIVGGVGGGLVTESPLASLDDDELLDLPLAPHERPRSTHDAALVVAPPSMPPPLPARLHSHSHVFIGVHGGDYVQAGTDLVGVIVLSLNESVPEAERLTLHFHGTETTCWLEEASGGAFTRCEENRVFCDRSIGIARFRSQGRDFSDPHDDDTLSLQLLSGSYSFPFKIAVPPEFPRCFQYDCSSIRYVLKATLETREGTPLLMSSKPVFIMESIPEGLPAPHLEESKRFMFAGDGPMTVQLDLERAVFYPGDEIKVRVLISNPTSKTVGRITTTVVQSVMLIAGDRSHDLNRVLCRASAEQAFVDARTPRAERTVVVRLPLPLAASVAKAQNIQCYAYVETEVAVSPLATGFKLRVPIVIAEHERHCKLLHAAPSRPRVLPTRSSAAAVSTTVSGAALDDVIIL